MCNTDGGTRNNVIQKHLPLIYGIVQCLSMSDREVTRWQHNRTYPHLNLSFVALN